MAQCVARLICCRLMPVSREFEPQQRLPLFHWARNFTLVTGTDSIVIYISIHCLFYNRTTLISINLTLWVWWISCRIYITGTDCGRNFYDEDRGNITSPGFPSGYPNNAHCYWRIYHSLVESGRAQWNVTIHSFSTQFNRDNVTLYLPVYNYKTK